MICQKWNLPPFTVRDKKANSPLDMIDLRKTPHFLTPPTLAHKATDRAGQTVSTGIGTDLGLTADEVTYPDDNRTVDGVGKLARKQFYTDSSGNPTTTPTPYWQAFLNSMQ